MTATKAEAAFWFTLGDGYKGSGIGLDELWDLHQATLEANTVDTPIDFDVDNPPTVDDRAASFAKSIEGLRGFNLTKEESDTLIEVLGPAMLDHYSVVPRTKPLASIMEDARQATQSPSKPSGYEVGSGEPIEEKSAESEAVEVCGGFLS